ncbi:acyltransferase family protein [Mycolicibacterium austroafricanum]|uniref:acyltransferase family protein n=1 Tax=Mycolicibacterium austroafricanum TaxID=39687 RepID=UPI001CA3294B|nr:acyltransferase [Mycolicibacterium austroafricanum]QZT58426.1 acyltransferase [Mycolicibacterium austroafricanum]
MADPPVGESSENPQKSAPVEPPLAVPTGASPRRLVTIQVLRGIAALMVVLYHVINQSAGFYAVLPTGVGRAGVDLFFVISGFVMVYVTADRERYAKQFLAMRAARIVPVYWFYTLSAAALMFVLPQLFRSNELTFRHVAMSLLFLPHETLEGSMSPVVKQGWTLNYEVFFYILFAIAMAIAARRRVTISITVLLIFAAVGYCLDLTGTSVGSIDFYFQSIILEFALGMLVASLFLQGKIDFVGPIIGIIVILVGFSAMLTLDGLYTFSNRAFIYGIPAAAIIIGVLAFESSSKSLRMPILQFIGDASYSVYLVHIFPVAVLRAIWPSPMAGALSFSLFLLLSVVSSIALGAASYYAVERTSLKYLRRLIARHLQA